MPSLLSTERKYNLKYCYYISQAYILLVIMLIFLFITISSWVTKNDMAIWTLLLLMYIPFFAFYLSFLSKGAEKNHNSWGTGYMVEELVGTKLAALGDGYRVIHDISKGKGKGNIDHIVIGPTGIFVIESKSNKNVMVYYKDYQRKISELGAKFMNQVARNACWVREMIKESLEPGEFIHGIIVRPLNDDKKTDMQCSNRVCIMDGNTVYDHIKNFNGNLRQTTIDQIYRNLCEIKRTNDKAGRTSIQKTLSIFL